METYEVNEDPMDKAFGSDADKSIRVFLHVRTNTPIINAHGLYHDCDVCNIGSDEECEKCPNNYRGTLRDISIILQRMVGQGVEWQLAGELAKRLNLNPYDVLAFLQEITYEYSELSEKEGLERFHSSPPLHTDPRKEIK